MLSEIIFGSAEEQITVGKGALILQIFGSLGGNISAVYERMNMQVAVGVGGHVDKDVHRAICLTVYVG